jgi:rhodanese-related sulfurtransferase
MKMKHIFSFILLMAGMSMYAQNHTSSHHISHQVETFYADADAAMVMQHMRSASDDIIFIDVRSADEVQHGKIGKAIQIDFKSKDFDEKIQALDKNKRYVVYCYNGSLSSKAAAKMKEAGFKQILNLKDGFKSWPSAE